MKFKVGDRVTGQKINNPRYLDGWKYSHTSRDFIGEVVKIRSVTTVEVKVLKNHSKDKHRPIPPATYPVDVDCLKLKTPSKISTEDVD